MILWGDSMFFDFLLAVFGIPYYLFRLYSEHVDTRRIRINREARDAAFKECQARFRERVLDQELEKTIKKRLEENETALEYRDELIETIDKELDWVDKDRFLMFYGNIDFPSYQKLALRILLGNRGKLRFGDVHGISPSVYYHRKATPSMRKKDLEETKRLAIWVNNKLKEHGINETLLARRSFEENYLVDDDFETPDWPASYFWKPDSIFTFDKDY